MNTDVEEQTEFKFPELSDRAKDTVRDAHRYDDTQDGWWDGVYEDAVRMGALLGISISSTTRKTARGRDCTTYDISSSGFCSQGDGACFEGEYRNNPDALLKIQGETNDEELIRIAQELTLLQLTRRLQGLEPLSANIKASGRYSHSGTMAVITMYDIDEDDETSYDDSLEDNVTQLMRDFADWIYKQLEAEYDYLTSDEYIDEWLNEGEDLFDEDGATI